MDLYPHHSSSSPSSSTGNLPMNFNNTGNTNNNKNNNQQSATLFLGDLSIFCQESDLYKLFQPYGPIESIDIKRSEKNKPCLAYGFIKFFYRDSAEQAMEAINGMIFLGRSIRVTWALDDPSQKSPIMKLLEEKKVKHTAQIHISFNSRNAFQPVTEATLRQLFSQFGEIVDVTINKTSFNKVATLPSPFLSF